APSPLGETAAIIRDGRLPAAGHHIDVALMEIVLEATISRVMHLRHSARPRRSSGMVACPPQVTILTLP
ncbi:hypothetical protein CKQ79_29695, partial [Klebsiella pneumoniae]